MSNNSCDLAIIGSGLTGMSVAIAAYCKNPDLAIKLFGIPYDSNTAKKGEIENIPGIAKTVGVDFIQQLVEQLQNLNSEFAQDIDSSEIVQNATKLDVTNEIVDSISKTKAGFNIVTEQQSIDAKAIVISTGLPELKHTIKGEDEFVHKGVSHCAVCDGALFRGRKVVIIGKGNFVARGALFLRKFCRKITLLCPENKLDCDSRFLKKIEGSSNINVKYSINLEDIEIFGNQTVEGLRYQAENEMKEISVNAVFIELKDIPDLSFAESLGIELTEEGFIKTNNFNATNIDGLYATGTVKGELDYAAILMGDGYKTGINVVEHLEELP